MNGIKAILKSFANAFSGLFTAIKNERNMRIELSICLLVYWFGHLYGLTTLETGIITLISAAVISAELFNTAIEETHDGQHKEINPHTKVAKDTAAAAVLLLAVASVIIGLLIFSDKARLSAALSKIANPMSIIFLVIYAVAAILFIHGKTEKKKERKQDNK